MTKITVCANFNSVEHQGLELNILFYMFSGVAALFAILSVVNVYDFLFKSELPWREGDFQSVMTINLSIFLISGVCALVVFMRRRNG